MFFFKEHQRQYKQWQKRGGMFGGPRRYDPRQQNQKLRPPSVIVKPDWEVSALYYSTLRCFIRKL